MSEDKKVVEFHRPSALEDENAAERDSRLRTLVAQRARQPAFERVLYLEDDAKKHNILSAKLKELIDAVVKENEKKARETKVEHEKREHRVEKKQITARREQRRERERQEREERREQERQEREQEREEREARKEIERKDREKQKAFAAIVKLPSAEHDGRLAALARQLGEDINILHEEFAELRIEEEERIKRGQVEPWDEPVNTRVLLNAVAAQFEKYIIIHDLTIAPIIPLWIAFAWLHDIATFSPILVIESADAGEGKTAASKTIALLTPARTSSQSQPDRRSTASLSASSRP